jgi:hypothetical protein
VPTWRLRVFEATADTDQADGALALPVADRRPPETRVLRGCEQVFSRLDIDDLTEGLDTYESSTVGCCVDVRSIAGLGCACRAH